MSDRSNGVTVAPAAWVIATGLITGVIVVAVVPALIQGGSAFFLLAAVLGGGVGILSAAAGLLIAAGIPAQRLVRTVVMVVATGIAAGLLGAWWKLVHPIPVALCIALACGVVALVALRPPGSTPPSGTHPGR